MVEMVEVENKEKEKKGGIEAIILGVGVILLLVAVIVGFVFAPTTLESLMSKAFGIFLIGAIVYGVYRLFYIYFQPKPYSPKDELKTKLVRICKQAKPPTVNNLYLRGEHMHQRALIGKIQGLGFWPLIEPKAKRNEKGEIVYKMDTNGQPVYSSRMIEGVEKKFPVPELEPISSKDGKVIIVVNPHGFPVSLFKHEHMIILAKPNQLSSLVGNIYIKDVALHPYGDYFFPAKDLQFEYKEIMANMESSVIMQTHYHWLDLASDITHQTLNADPVFQKLMLMKSAAMPSTTETTV